MGRLLFLGFVLVLPALGWAQKNHNQVQVIVRDVPWKGLRVEKTDQGVYVYGSSCYLLRGQIQALSFWKERVESRKIPDPSFLTKASDVPCEVFEKEARVKIDDYLPAWVIETQGKKTGFKGPNCWNSTLYLSNILPYLRYSSDEEMKFWMNSPLCRPLTATEPRLPGDVIAIRDAKGAEIHGFIHISDDLAFSKNGCSADAPYGIKSKREVFDVYEVPVNCRDVVGVKVPCTRQANYFRCEALASYLENKPELKARFQCLDEKVSNTEKVISSVALTGDAPKTCSNIVELKNTFCASDKMGVLPCPTNKTESVFFEGAYENRLKSNHTQIDLIEKKERR